MFVAALVSCTRPVVFGVSFLALIGSTPVLAQDAEPSPAARITAAIEAGKPLVQRLEILKTAAAKEATELLEVARNTDGRSAMTALGRVLAEGQGAKQKIDAAAARGQAAQESSQALQKEVGDTTPRTSRHCKAKISPRRIAVATANSITAANLGEAEIEAGLGEPLELAGL